MAQVRNERVGQRDAEMAYSRYHRNRLSSRCAGTDIDMFEVRRGKIVAMTEHKLNFAEMTQFQAFVYQTVAKALDIPAFIIRYRVPGKLVDWNAERDKVPDPEYTGWKFYIEPLNGNAQRYDVVQYEWLSEPEFRQFMEGL